MGENVYFTSIKLLASKGELGMDVQEKKLVEDILHKVQVRAIIIGVPALLAIFFTMFSLLNSGKQGHVTVGCVPLRFTF